MHPNFKKREYFVIPASTWELWWLCGIIILARLVASVVSGPWRTTASHWWEGFHSLFSLFRCLLRRNDEAAATSWSQNKVLPALSSLRWCIPRQQRARGVVCLTDFMGSNRFSRSFVWSQVSLFWSTVVIIGDGWCLVRWSFRALARWFPVCLLQKALLWQALPSSDDGGARTATRLQLALVSVVVATWSSDLIIIFYYFWNSLYYCWWLLIDQCYFAKKKIV
jgi:hypothetical protein